MPPKTRKGSVRKYEICAVGWLDLLGYGSMLSPTGFDPSTEQAKLAVSRLNDFHIFSSKIANRYLQMLAMNDGIITFRDMSPRTSSVTYDFIRRNFKLYKEVNQFDKENGFYGARMILSPGFRVRDEKKSNTKSTKGKTILKKLRNKEISPEQAVYEALETRPPFGIVPELQANFAFTKSYLADCLGSKGGFGGNRMFLDTCFFKNMEIPTWIEYSDKIKFEEMGMKTTFIAISDIDFEQAGKNQNIDVLDAFEIGKNLANDEDILKRLLDSTYGNNLRSKN